MATDWTTGTNAGGVEVLYTYFNKLPLSPSDIDRCRKLDRLKFIPRGSANRKGYEKMNIKKYMRHDILSPGKISLSDYEAICWSQRGCVTHEPNSTLRGTYQNLGKPTGKEVVKHLRVLTELGKKYGRRPALLLDLKATYKWLNENVDEIFVHIRNENRKSIFLNVDNPDSDSWVWHSGSTLVKGLQDIGDLHWCQGFSPELQQSFDDAGVRTIQKVTTEAVAAMDKTPLFRSQFRDMREQGFEVCVTFKARDHELQLPPAHKAWLSVNSKHFWRTFVASKAEPCVEVDASDYSSHCVKETIDWMYAGELPTFITSPSSNNGESKAKLDLALNILSLAHRWEITELHQRLQEFIVNLSDFINPYWVKHICKCAELAEAKELSRACNDFEAKNRVIMHQILSTEYNNV
ncbi:hypothetical protein F5887DRAFT_922915 [Amanita rubescens]|nr:hypothetical protein F5887DRAFT_922915 [Amanita rubescens]